MPSSSVATWKSGSRQLRKSAFRVAVRARVPPTSTSGLYVNGYAVKVTTCQIAAAYRRRFRSCTSTLTKPWCGASLAGPHEPASCTHDCAPVGGGYGVPDPGHDSRSVYEAGILGKGCESRCPLSVDGDRNLSSSTKPAPPPKSRRKPSQASRQRHSPTPTSLIRA